MVDISNPHFMCHEDRNGVIPKGQAVMLSTWEHEYYQSESRLIPTPLDKIFEYYCFGNVKFWQQKSHNILRTHKKSYTSIEDRTQNLCDTNQCALPLSHRCAVVLNSTSEISVYIEATDYRSNLAKMILFENCSCFSKIPFSIWVESPRIFQGLISISVDQ